MVVIVEWPKGKQIHVHSESEGQAVIDYYSTFGYVRTKGHSAYPFMEYPYLCLWEDVGITGYKHPS